MAGKTSSKPNDRAIDAHCILLSLLHKDHEKRAPYKCERCAFATHSPLWLKRHVQRVHEKVSEIQLNKFLILIRFMKFESFDKN